MVKYLTVTTALIAVAAACVLVLPGCERVTFPPTGQAPKVESDPVLQAKVFCLDGWQVLVVNDNNATETMVYRHQHDVAEHLVSCQGTN